MCLFTNSKEIKIGQPSQEKSGVSKNTVTVNHLVQDTMIHGFFKGVIFTMMVVIALLDAILQVWNFKRIYKVSLAHVRFMAITGRAS